MKRYIKGKPFTHRIPELQKCLRCGSYCTLKYVKAEDALYYQCLKENCSYSWPIPYSLIEKMMAVKALYRIIGKKKYIINYDENGKEIGSTLDPSFIPYRKPVQRTSKRKKKE